MGVTVPIRCDPFGVGTDLGVSIPGALPPAFLFIPCGDASAIFARFIEDINTASGWLSLLRQHSIIPGTVKGAHCIHALREDGVDSCSGA